MEPAEGTTVWVSTVPGTKTNYENIPYTYARRGDEPLLLAGNIPIFFHSFDEVAFYAGTHFTGTTGNGSSGYVSLADQSDLASIDYWVSEPSTDVVTFEPIGKGSKSKPRVTFEFSSQLAKVRLLVHVGDWAPNEQLVATAKDISLGYTHSSAMPSDGTPNVFTADTKTGNIDLRMTDLGNGTWLAEGLFVPGTMPSIALTAGPGKTASLKLEDASGFGSDNFSKGITYAAEVSIASDGTTTIERHEAIWREAWRTTWYDGLFSEFITGNLAPATVCGSPVTMDGPTSWGIHQDTPLRGKVTLAPDTVEVRMQDLYFTSPDGAPECVRYKEGDNVFEFKDLGGEFEEENVRWAHFQVEGSTEWITEPVPLAPGETKTVMIRLGMEHRYYYYSIDITRPKVEISSQPQDVTVNEGAPATFQVATTGTEGVAYQWQTSIDGATWKDVDGANEATLPLDAATMNMDGAQYRCLMTIPSGASSSETIVSDVATLRVKHIHNASGTWSSDASGHWHACTGCDEKLDFAAHAETTVGAKEPTCTEDGNTGETTCTICSATLVAGETIPATGHSFQNGSCVTCGTKDPSYEVPPAPTPEPDPGPKPDPDPKPNPEPGPGGAPNPNPGSRPNPDSGTDIQPDSKPDFDPNSDTVSKPTPEPGSQSEPESNQEPEQEQGPGTKPSLSPDSKSTPKPGLPATGDTSPVLASLACLAGASALVIARAIHRRDNA